MYNDKTRLCSQGNLNFLINLFLIDLETESQFVTIIIVTESCPFDKTGTVHSFNYS